jgi:hypothetical protein
MIPAADELHLRYTLTPPLGPRRVVARGSTLLNDGKSTINGPDGKPIRGEWCWGNFTRSGRSRWGIYYSVFPRILVGSLRWFVTVYRQPLSKNRDWTRNLISTALAIVQVKIQATRHGPTRRRWAAVSRCPIEATLSVDGTILPPVKTTTG